MKRICKLSILFFAFLYTCTLSVEAQSFTTPPSSFQFKHIYGKGKYVEWLHEEKYFAGPDRNGYLESQDKSKAKKYDVLYFKHDGQDAVAFRMSGTNKFVSFVEGKSNQAVMSLEDGFSDAAVWYPQDAPHSDPAYVMFESPAWGGKHGIQPYYSIYRLQRLNYQPKYKSFRIVDALPGSEPNLDGNWYAYDVRGKNIGSGLIDESKGTVIINPGSQQAKGTISVSNGTINMRAGGRFTGSYSADEGGKISWNNRTVWVRNKRR